MFIEMSVTARMVLTNLAFVVVMAAPALAGDVELYIHPSYEGASRSFDGSAKQLGDFDGQTSSLKINVNRWVRFYTFEQWDGIYIDFQGPTKIPHLSVYKRGIGGNWEDEIASFKIMPASFQP